jgi:hypothetical protein
LVDCLIRHYENLVRAKARQTIGHRTRRGKRKGTARSFLFLGEIQVSPCNNPGQVQRLVPGVAAILSCAALSGLPLVAEAAPVTFADGTFTDADWVSSLQVINGPPGALSFSAAQSASGGNPGPYRLNTRTWGGDNRGAVFNFKVAAVYDPSTQGAIGSIDFFQDVIGLSNASIPGTYGAGIAVLQGGQAYFAAATPLPLTSSTWASRSSLGLTALDFGVFGAAGLPDFSAGGGPITFGYWRSNTIPDPVRTAADGIDNWRVVVNPASSSVPEPASLALFGIGLGLLTRFARRRTA